MKHHDDGNSILEAGVGHRSSSRGHVPVTALSGQREPAIDVHRRDARPILVPDLEALSFRNQACSPVSAARRIERTGEWRKGLVRPTPIGHLGHNAMRSGLVLFARCHAIRHRHGRWDSGAQILVTPKDTAAMLPQATDQPVGSFKDPPPPARQRSCLDPTPGRATNPGQGPPYRSDNLGFIHRQAGQAELS